MKKYDRGIKEALNDMLDATPPSPLGKDETWERIRSQMTRNRVERKPRKRPLYMAASVIIIAFVALSSSPKHASASFGWLTKLFVQIEGTLTQIMGTTSTSDNNTKKPPAPAVDITSDEIKLETLTIDEARLITTFGMVVPTYIPSGYTFSGVYVQKEGDKKSSHVLLKYNDDAGELIEITETDTNHQRGYSFGIDNDDTEVEDIIVPGAKGNILTFKNGSKKVVINKQNIQLVIDSKLSDKEIQAILNSL